MHSMIMNDGININHYRKRFKKGIFDDFDVALSCLSEEGLIYRDGNHLRPVDLIFEWKIVESLQETLDLDFEFRIR